MQVTLVSHYGPKPDAFASLIHECQQRLIDGFGSAFRPYEIEQVHGTIIGLEGALESGRVVNRNAAGNGQATPVDVGAVLQLIREMPRIDIHVGGFVAAKDYGFTSRGEHPFDRSFSMQGGVAVAIGWPMTNALDELRWAFWRRLGVRHAYHNMLTDHDNDFFFVLGRVDGSVEESEVKRSAVSSVRRYLGTRAPLVLSIHRATLQIVAYVDPQLPLRTSRVFAVADAGVTPALVRSLYD